MTTVVNEHLHQVNAREAELKLEIAIILYKRRKISAGICSG